MNASPHAAFWWIWAALIAIATLRIQSSALSILSILAITLFPYLFKVSQERRRIYFFAFKFAAIALSIRMFFAITIGVPLLAVKSSRFQNFNCQIIWWE
jgi:hypothetical protein